MTVERVRRKEGRGKWERKGIGMGGKKGRRREESDDRGQQERRDNWVDAYLFIY